MKRNKMMRLQAWDGYGVSCRQHLSLEEHGDRILCKLRKRNPNMKWNVATDGYQAYCPVCGNRLMLCDECMHSNPDGSFTDCCDYSSQTDRRFRQKRKERLMKILRQNREAKAYGEEHLTKNTHELVNINGVLYILCDTDQVKGHLIRERLRDDETIHRHFRGCFCPEDVSDPHDFAPDARDWVESYLELLGIRFLDVYDEY